MPRKMMYMAKTINISSKDCARKQESLNPVYKKHCEEVVDSALICLSSTRVVGMLMNAVNSEEQMSACSSL